MTGTLVFDPLLPWIAIGALGGLAVLGVALALWHGLAGWGLRALAALVIVAALAQPSWQREERAPLDDIVLIVEDKSASQTLADRAGLTENAATTLEEELAGRPNTQIRRIEVGDGEENSGTQLMTAVSEALAEEPPAQVAGILLLSDGRLHDLERAPDLPAPMHLLMTGQEDDWDRRLIVENAPAFAILDEPVTLTVRVEDEGAAPDVAQTTIDISVDGAEPQTFDIPIGQSFDLPITLPHGGLNVIQFTVPEAEGEITDRNNTALVQINGVRDRLRVLLVSGEPHAGGRTWRNLLKSDSSVDLVHFTILRPPEKQDGVPVNELSLIAFPTRELFLEKIEDFDLIIFDRYKRRGILPSIYLDNVRNYVEEGGAVMIAAGPDFASADSLARTPLGEVLPATPTARVIEEAFRPEITELGERHPVTSGLGTAEDWGRWLRQIDVTPTDSAEVVMSGTEGRPLLVLDRIGEGRVALMASDQAWLWSRGYEGGGPQLELLRRLAHWMMKEPELEEETLFAEPTGQRMRIVRRTLGEEVGPVTVTRPDGETETVTLEETSPGRFEAVYEGPEIGLYRLEEGEQEAVVGLGPAAPREFEQTIATASLLEPVLDTVRGGTARLENGLPDIREVSPGRPAAGRGWIGITPREAYETLNVTQVPALPAWLVLLLASGLILAAWLRESRR
ncbi:Putative glutamine amidotransferase [Roseivivax marinus]|uniref:glutamine amidotransferase n=1 Tax=Roseivivax marinus TaxID=1379903 RepID=UPI0008CB9089|nr:glutamine amidotransferase [Roseivivax marinus]SEK62582.1 Putative glutamine amidotransferase [Roseivivax marinus]